jgi:hypothetical protein
MGDVIQIRKFKRKRAEGKTLCSAGFHKWEIQSGRRFDVKEGRLVSTERCSRCGEERTRLK